MKEGNLIDLVFKFSFRVIEGGKDKLEFKKIRILCNYGLWFGDRGGKKPLFSLI